MKKNNALFIFILLAFLAPVGGLLFIPGASTMLRRVNSLAGDSLLFSIFASLALILVYLAYRLVYNGKNDRKTIEYSATALSVHLLSMSLWILVFVGALPVYHVIDVNEIASSSNWISLSIILSTLLHLVLDLPLYGTKSKAQLDNRIESTRRASITGIIGSTLTCLVAGLFYGAIDPSHLPSALILAGLLLGEILYLIFAEIIVSKTFAS